MRTRLEQSSGVIGIHSRLTTPLLEERSDIGDAHIVTLFHRRQRCLDIFTLGDTLGRGGGRKQFSDTFALLTRLIEHSDTGHIHAQDASQKTTLSKHIHAFITPARQTAALLRTGITDTFT